MSSAQTPTTTVIRTTRFNTAWRLGWIALAIMIGLPFADAQRSSAAPGDPATLDVPISAQGVIASDGNQSLRPQVAADSANNLHVVWHSSGTGVKYSKGTWNGATYSWSAPVDVYVGSGTSDYIYPRIAIDSNDVVHVVWTWSRTLYYKSFPASTTPSSGTPNTTLAGAAFYPSVAIGTDNHVHVVWQGDTNNGTEIFYREWTGAGFTPAVNLTVDDINNVSADIAVDTNNVPTVVWYDGVSGGKINWVRRVNGVWVNKQAISEASSYYPSIVADGQGCVHMAWGTLGNLSQTVYRKACGGSFVDTRNIGGTNTARTTVGVSPSGKVVVAWTNKSGVETLSYVLIRDGALTAQRQVAPSGTNQLWPDATGRDDGRLAVTWQQQSGDQFDPYFAYIDACSATGPVVQGAPDVSSSATVRIYMPFIPTFKPAGC